MRKAVSVSLTSLGKVSFLRGVFPLLFFVQQTSVALLCLVVGGGGFRKLWDPSTQEILPLLRALTYEAERTLDLPRHGAARACPLVGPFEEEGESIGIASDVEGGSGPPRLSKGGQGEEVRRRFSLMIVGAYSLGSLVKKPRDSNDSPRSV